MCHTFVKVFDVNTQILLHNPSTENFEVNMIGPRQQEFGRANRDYPWDEFNSVEYFKFNYVDMRDDDREIVELVRDFMARKLTGAEVRAGARGIDVGTGANLYPALTMLPFCENITLYEHSETNVQWLREQSTTGWPSWDEAWSDFWKLLSERKAYAVIADPKDRLAKQIEVVKGDILSQSTHEQFDIGTMFFVAETITTKPTEFLMAMDHFFSMLKPDSPFAMAFMEHSLGSQVGTQTFPATDIGEQDVWKCLRRHATEFSLHRLSAEDKPLREHYTGMIVAYGRIKKAR